jgi:hypothetical protein
MDNYLRKQYRKSVPMIVQRTLYQQLETREHMCILAFTRGAADQSHFDTLLYVMNLLLVAGQTDPKRKYALDYAQKIMKPALEGIKARINNTGKFGMNAQELQAMKDMIKVSREFWMRQTVELYKFSCDQVDSFYDEIKQRNEAATA